jgi:opacity protein-like surface antigen
MYKFRLVTLLLAFCLNNTFSFAQDLLSELDKDAPKQKEFTSYTFKASRLINSSTIESLGQGVLDFRIAHRFGQLSQGIENFYGVDNAVTKLSIDYGITPRIMVGIGHSAFNKEDDGFVKVKILAQSPNHMPVTVSYFGGVSIETMPAPTLPLPTDTWNFSSRLFYAHQILIAKKFNPNFSLQIMPTLIHYNIVDSSSFDNNTFALGIGGRIKITKRAAISAEYYYRLNNTNMLVYGQPTYNAFSIAYELETGGHVFQFVISNAQALTERSFIGQCTDTWSKNQLHLGFNISRVFTIIKPKGYTEKDDDDKKW